MCNKCSLIVVLVVRLSDLEAWLLNVENLLASQALLGGMELQRAAPISGAPAGPKQRGAQAAWSME